MKQLKLKRRNELFLDWSSWEHVPMSGWPASRPEALRAGRRQTAFPCHLNWTPTFCLVRSFLLQAPHTYPDSSGVVGWMWSHGAQCGRVVTEALWRRIDLVKMNFHWTALRNHDMFLSILSRVPLEPRLPALWPMVFLDAGGSGFARELEELQFLSLWHARDRAGGPVCCVTVKCLF